MFNKIIAITLLTLSYFTYIINLSMERYLYDMASFQIILTCLTSLIIETALLSMKFHL